jgi:TonB-dependent SusC/RagA subfamily outer membrane receptor
MDIDPENIEEITILRGAAATALYGSRAANGAVIIKSKQGKPGQPLQFNYSAEARADRPIIEGYITDWAAGSRGYFCNGRLLSQGGWCEPISGHEHRDADQLGPAQGQYSAGRLRFRGEVRFRDARSDFYRTQSPIPPRFAAAERWRSSACTRLARRMTTSAA